MSSLRRTHRLRHGSDHAEQCAAFCGWCVAQTASDGRLVVGAATAGVCHSVPRDGCFTSRGTSGRGGGLHVACRRGIPPSIGVSVAARRNATLPLCLAGSFAGRIGRVHKACTKRSSANAVVANSALAHVPASIDTQITSRKIPCLRPCLLDVTTNSPRAFYGSRCEPHPRSRTWR